MKPLHNTKGNLSKLVAKSFRKKPTLGERILWQELRNSKLGYPFRRQKLVEDFIVDFYCYSCSLIIFIDGDLHDCSADKDLRMIDLLSQRYHILRFPEEMVLANVEDCVEEIKTKIREVMSNTIEYSI